ncbi:C-C motif chemokine 4-like [Siniperca chuatsi]|uniref:C-C motif chemokine 4-like n=1 Tax=Siniperca chuatsi TaxID=119488 RepID=UPI001CE1C628|nr:C-C motif chemokine 4-like [Siniperca chuatsi]
MMMMMMKNPIILVTCILLFTSLTVMASPTSFGPNECCFEFFSRRLPKNRVVRYKHTDKQCPKTAVIFTMMNGAELCTNPSEPWVQNIIVAKEKALGVQSN